MATYREVRTQPAEGAGEEYHRGGIGGVEKGEAEPRAVGLGQKPHFAVEKAERHADQEQRDQAAGYALQEARVVERPAHEPIGRADQLRDLDLLSLSED